MRVFLLAAFGLVACHAPATTTSDPPIAVKKIAPQTPAAHGGHGRAIAALAVSEEGTVAITADRTGAMRVWPSLDGKREPFAVEGPPSRELAIVVDGETYAVALIDESKNVEIVRWSPRGERLARIQIDVPAIELHAVLGSFVIVGADRTAYVYSTIGTLRGRLAPEPGGRVVSIAANSGRALAMIDQGETIHGRWIELATAEWGAVTPELPLDGEAIALSPDHHTLLGRDRTGKIALVDSITGTATANDLGHPCAGAEPRAIGFADATTFACVSTGVIQWWKVGGARWLDNGRFASSAIAMTPTGIVVAHDRQLSLLTATSARYLGYHTETFPHVRFSPTGILVGVGDQRAMLLDDELRAGAPIKMPDVDGTWRDIVQVDDRTVLALVEKGDRKILIVDREKGSVGLPLDVDGRVDRIDYDPASRALLVDHPGGRMLYRFDPVRRAFDPVATIDSPLAVFVDPKLAHGASILMMKPTTDTGFAARYIDATELDAGGKKLTSYRVPGEFRAFDRAARIYTVVRDDTLDVTVFERTKDVLVIPSAAGFRTIPNADGSRIAIVESMRITLVDGAGATKWAMPVWNATQVEWAAGGLVAQMSGAFVRFDLETGAFARRQCGWEFGIWEAPITPLVSEDDLVCDVAR